MKRIERKWLKSIIFPTILGSISSAMAMLGLYYVSVVMDYAISGDLQLMLTSAGIAFFFYLFGLFGLGSLYSHLNYKVSIGTVSDIAIAVVRNAYKKSTNLFRSKNDAYYTNILINDVFSLFNKRYSNIPLEMRLAVEILVAFSILIYISPIIFGMAIASMAVPIVSTALFSKLVQKHSLRNSNAWETFTSDATETIQAYEHIKLNGKIDGYLAKISSSINFTFATTRKYWFVSAQNYRTQHLTSITLMLILLSIGGYLVSINGITVGELLAAVLILSNISNTITNFFSARTERKGTKPIYDKIADELADDETQKDKKDIEISHTPAVTYNNINFGFEDKQLYNNFSFTFNPGGCYAILGESGSGKSTLAKLLLGYYNNYEGKISIDGKDVQGISENSLFDIVGIVHQSPFMLNDNLYNNITMFDNSVGAKEVEDLLKELSLTDLAKRVGDTPLGDFGDNISGGERQRISIARTLIKKPKVIIFDEPTTGLDPENTKIINEYIFSLKDITRIVISHNQADEYVSRFDDVIRLD